MERKYLIKNYDLISKNELLSIIEKNNLKLNVDYEKGEIIIREEVTNVNDIQSALYDVNPRCVLVEVIEEKTFKKILLLNNLDCANCAAKIERLAQKNLDNEFISVDFATCRFVIETKNKELYDNIIPEVQKIANIVDSKIVVTDKKAKGESGKRIVNEKEERINRITFIVGTVLFFVVLILHYFVFYLTIDNYVLDNINENPLNVRIPLIVLSFISYILLGGDVLLAALKNVKNGRFFDEKFLMALATVVAFAIHSYIEAIGVMVFYKIGELLQEIVVNKSRSSISELMDIKPQNATLVMEGKEIEIDPTQIMLGDILIIKPGERIPADGIVLEGEANIDTSALTGESKYYIASKGKKVVSGSINLDGILKIEVKKKYNDSMVSKIIDLVENASANKAKTEKFVTKFAKYYTPIVCALAVIIVVFILIFSDRTLHDAIYPAMVFLVVSCPCALVISVPLGYFGSIGSASRRGILVKGSNCIDELNKAGIVAFDKTGTLTKGKFTIQEVISTNANYDENSILTIAAHCESVSSHPMGKSIIKHFGIENINKDDIKPIAINKKGIQAEYKGNKYSIGSYQYMTEKNIKAKEIIDAGVVVYIADVTTVIGYIKLIDEIRPESIETVKLLKEMGYEVVMLTGDSESSAKTVAKEIGIEKYYAGLSPIEKVKKLRQIKKQFKDKKMVFVGDGINDAPVMNNSDIAIAMGKFGTDIAIEVSDVVLMNDDLSKIIDLFKIAKKTKKIVLENIIFALSIKFIVLFLAVVVSSGTIKMWEGVFADVGVSLIATINSLRAAAIDKAKFFKELNVFDIKKNDKETK